MYLKILKNEENNYSFTFLSSESYFLPSIKKTKFDNIEPKTGVQIFS